MSQSKKIHWCDFRFQSAHSFLGSFGGARRKAIKIFVSFPTISVRLDFIQILQSKNILQQIEYRSIYENSSVFVNPNI